MAQQPIIFLATDHAGFDHKNAVLAWLKEEGYDVRDCGNTRYEPEDDFTDFINIAARNVAALPQTHRALIFGGSGQGEAMLANRYLGVRAAVFYGGPDEIITLSRQHNDANVLSIGARFVPIDEAKRVIWMWLHTQPFTEEKYVRRNTKIRQITEKISNFLATEIR